MKLLIKIFITVLIINCTFFIQMYASDGNTLYGINAGASITTEDSISAFGYNAGQSLTTENYNLFLGSDAGKSNTSTLNSIFIGHQAGHNSNGGFENILIGSYTGYFNITMEQFGPSSEMTTWATIQPQPIFG